MSKTKSSKRWLHEHATDEYVLKARQEGYRSRAVYKLDEIHNKYKVIRPGMTVLDLGAAPGGWSQYAVKKVGRKGSVIATDILPMEPLPGVRFIQRDFREQEGLDQLTEILGERGVDLVMSDMAPNISGMKAVDQPRAMYLAELAVDFADQFLVTGGGLLVKVFQGEGFEPLLATIRAGYGHVTSCKPKASRDRSREVYILGRNHTV